MLIINGKHQQESPLTVLNVKPQKPLEQEKKVESEKKTVTEPKPVETAALDVKPEKEKPKKRPVHGVETRHRTRR